MGGRTGCDGQNTDPGRRCRSFDTCGLERRYATKAQGRGIPDKQPGDLYVELQIALPPADSEEAKAFYQNMESEFDFNPRSNMGAKA